MFLKKKIACLVNPYDIDIIIGRHIHALLKNPSEMTFTDIAHIRKVLYTDVFIIIMSFHIIQCRHDLNIPRILSGHLTVYIMDPDQFYCKRLKKSTNLLMIHIFFSVILLADLHNNIG